MSWVDSKDSSITKDRYMMLESRHDIRPLGRVLMLTTLFGFTLPLAAFCQAGEVAQLINGSNQNIATALNGGHAFVTNFQGVNDLAVTMNSGGDMDANYVDHFVGGATSNNPGYITGFVGSSANGTGDGTSGGFNLIQQTAGTTLTFDFSIPLTSSDHFLVADVDNDEKYSMTAYTLSGGVYSAVSLTGWTLNAYTGQMGILPNSDWPTWNPTGGGLTTGTFTSNDDVNLNEPLDVLTPNQSISRIVFTEIQGDGTPGLQFYAASVPEPSSLVLAGIAAMGGLGVWARRHRG
jgi:hypothetical protein